MESRGSDQWVGKFTQCVRVHTYTHEGGAVQATALWPLCLVPSGAGGGTTPPPKVGRPDAGFAPGGLESEAGVLDTACSEETCPRQQVSWGRPGTPRGALCRWEQGLLPRWWLSGRLGGGCAQAGRPLRGGLRARGLGVSGGPRCLPCCTWRRGLRAGCPQCPEARPGPRVRRAALEAEGSALV